MSEALILQHGATGPPGILAEWAAARDLPISVHRIDLGGPLPELDGQLMIASLGSKHNPTDTHVPAVVAELEYLHRAVERAVPILGLCFGAQMLASVLGATIAPAPAPELGWQTIDSVDPELVSTGPWLSWHYDSFTLPAGATQLASSAAGVQAFTHGRHLGVQFHPESTIEIVSGWADSDRDRLTALGIDDGPALLEAGRRFSAQAARSAFDLFDGFWRRVTR